MSNTGVRALGSLPKTTNNAGPTASASYSYDGPKQRQASSPSFQFPEFAPIPPTQQTSEATGYHPNFGLYNLPGSQHQLNTQSHLPPFVPQTQSSAPLNALAALCTLAKPITLPPQANYAPPTAFAATDTPTASVFLAPPTSTPPPPVDWLQHLPQVLCAATAVLVKMNSKHFGKNDKAGSKIGGGGIGVGKGGQSGKGRRKSGGNNAQNQQTPTPGNRPRKNGRNKTRNAQEKLVQIRKFLEHAGKYKIGSLTTFPAMISQLLKEHTCYEVLGAGSCVFQTYEALYDQLVQEGSGTQIERDDFKATVEQFGACLEAVKNELQNSVKNKESQAAELFEAAVFELGDELVLELDDEPIPGIGSEASSSAALAGEGHD